MQRKVLGAQYVSRMCAVCGQENSTGLHARFLELDGGELVGAFQPREEHQGYPGRLHGGIATAILDETIGRAINLTQEHVWGVTVELGVRFRRPVPLEEEIRAVGRITEDSGRLFEGTGEIVLADGTVAVEATGKYLKLPIDRIAEGDFDRTEWRRDDRPLPGSIDIPSTGSER
jgi:acyl-coenzyme A thioesterase PaaI-like protein